MRSTHSLRRGIRVLGLACALAVATGRAAPAEDASLDVRVGAVDLRIPPEFVVERPQAPDLLGWLPDLDEDVESLTIRVPEDYVAHKVPAYVVGQHLKRRTILFSLTVLRGEELKRARYPKYVTDAAEGRGSFSQRVVEADEPKGTIRIFRQSEYPRKWTGFSGSLRSADDQGEIVNSWIGNCSRSVDASGKVGGTESCRRIFVIENVLVEFSVRNQDEQVLPGIEALLRELVASWPSPEPRGG